MLSPFLHAFNVKILISRKRKKTTSLYLAFFLIIVHHTPATRSAFMNQNLPQVQFSVSLYLQNKAPNLARKIILPRSSPSLDSQPTFSGTPFMHSNLQLHFQILSIFLIIVGLNFHGPSLSQLQLSLRAASTLTTANSSLESSSHTHIPPF